MGVDDARAGRHERARRLICARTSISSVSHSILSTALTSYLSTAAGSARSASPCSSRARTSSQMHSSETLSPSSPWPSRTARSACARGVLVGARAARAHARSAATRPRYLLGRAHLGMRTVERPDDAAAVLVDLRLAAPVVWDDPVACRRAHPLSVKRRVLPRRGVVTAWAQHRPSGRARRVECRRAPR